MGIWYSKIFNFSITLLLLYCLQISNILLLRCIFVVLKRRQRTLIVHERCINFKMQSVSPHCLSNVHSSFLVLSALGPVVCLNMALKQPRWEDVVLPSSMLSASSPASAISFIWVDFACALVLQRFAPLPPFLHRGCLFPPSSISIPCGGTGARLAGKSKHAQPLAM